MRFAYIDSNGNEVPIPSVDALALRIELGAIGEDTQLYDAQADQWGPAHTHEIYHSLSRSASGGEGFVAPPPVAPPPSAPVSTPPPAKKAPPAPAPPPAEPEPVEPEDDGDLGLTLADPQPEPEPEEESEPDLGLTLAAAPEPEAPGDFGSLELADPMDSSESGQGDPSPGFDFGDMAGGLQMEEPEAGPSPVDAPLDLGGGLGAATPALDFSGGMDLESPMDFGAGGFDSGSGSLDLEQPMSEFSPDAPPSWMDAHAEADDGGDVMDFSSSVAGAGAASEDEVPLRDRRTPRNKPSAPKLRKQRNVAGPLVAAVILVAVGVGGYVAWPLVSARIAARGEPTEPAVVIPDIPTELIPQMQSVAGAALAAAYEGARTEWASSSPVSAPPQDWLAGVYLANASQYEQVATFWEGMADLLDAMRAVDVGDFDAAYAAELGRQGVSEENASIMRARADSGFVASIATRTAILDRFDNLIASAMRLHQFLVANEANIEYAPASVRTTDPVLEVNPATPAIGDAMGDLLDAVTRSLGALNYREAVTARGVFDVIVSEVQASGIR